MGHNRFKIFPLLKKIGAWRPSLRWVHLTRWQSKVLDAVVRCGIVFGIALMLEAAFLYGGKILWIIYQATEVGQYYVEQFPDRAEPIQTIIELNLIMLGWKTTVAALLTCLCLGCIGQLTGIRRYVYDPRGIPGRLAYGAVPAAAVSAWVVNAGLPQPHWAISFTLVTVPTLCMLSCSFALTQALLPELGELVGRVRGRSGPAPNWRVRAGQIIRWLIDKLR